MSKQRDKAVLAVAREYFDREDLVVRNSDSLDFFEVSVLGAKRALEAAYEAGRRAGTKEGHVAGVLKTRKELKRADDAWAHEQRQALGRGRP